MKLNRNIILKGSKMEFFAFLGLASNLPFAISLALMAGIGGLQVVSLVMGLGVSEVIDDAFDFDADVDVDLDVDVDVDLDLDADVPTALQAHADDFDLNGDGPTFAHNFFGWLQLGRVPFLILLSAFLGTFGLFGAIGQWFIAGAFGAPLTAMIAGPLALLAALPATRVVGKFLGRIMPKEETSSIMLSDLTGQTATIIMGTASAGSSAEAKIVDRHGTTHFLRVEPLDESQEFHQGAVVRLMEKKGNTFKVAE